MDRTQQLEVFKAQVENVKELEHAWRQLKRSINSDLIANDAPSARIHTKTLALVYCAWSEAVFSKLIHTPYGFELNEIEQIKTAQSSGIVNAWKKCIELASNKIASRAGNYVPNIRQSLVRLLDSYITRPSLIRNKVAHGQWVVALNRDNTSRNNELTAQISDLDIVKLDILHQAFIGLSEIVEAMIESPNRAFPRDYWPIVTRIETQLSRTSKFTLADKVTRLQAKAARTPTRHSREVL